MDAKTRARTETELLQPKLFPGRNQTLSLTRFLPATPEQVFALWTEAAHLLHWFAPAGSSIVLCETSLRVGGKTELVLQGSDGERVHIRRQYLLITVPKRLLYSEQCVGSSGVFYEALTTVTFEKLGNKTKLTLRAEPDLRYSSAEQDEWRRGCNELLNRVEQYLPLVP